MKNHLMKFNVLFVLAVAAIAVALGSKTLTPALLADSSGRKPDEINLPAPELVGGPWINTADGKTLNLAGRRGKVTIVEFWTFGCGNCRANLPSYANWQKQFADKDVVVIGVHTPETASERVTANVVRNVKQLGITYPVLLDQEHANWNRWQVDAWPTAYLVDKQGRTRYRWVGELNYRNAGGEAKLGRLVEQLLKEDSAKTR
ncbi:MAG: redoxin domain-containing protein [Blastocatellia bacterium]